MNAMPEDAGNLLDNRQAQAQAAILIGSLHITALELLENLLQAMLGNAHAAVPDFDRQALMMPPATEHHATTVGIADRIAQQVAQNPGEQLDVTAHQRRTADEVQLQAFTARHLGVFGGQVVQQFTEGERRNVGLDHPRIELGNIHQGAEQVLHVFQGIAHVAHQNFAGHRLAPLQQGTGKQPSGIQRLQQVMADGGEELGLRQVGLLGFLLGLAQA
ncbi:hypothetical protein D3C85_1013800 [compost metagenome]